MSPPINTTKVNQIKAIFLLLPIAKVVKVKVRVQHKIQKIIIRMLPMLAQIKKALKSIMVYSKIIRTMKINI